MRSRAIETPGAIERTQTGVRLEKRLLKVCKALVELYDLSAAEVLETLKPWCAMPSPAASRSQAPPWGRLRSSRASSSPW